MSVHWSVKGPQSLQSHYALLASAITQQLGTIAGSLVRLLCMHGSLTLKNLADLVKQEPFSQAASLSSVQAVRSNLTVNMHSTPEAAAAADPLLLTDAAIKELVTRLVIHRVLGHNQKNHTYHVLLGTGLLLRVFFPLVAHCVHRRYGEAGEAVVLVLHQLSVLPFDTAVKLAQERRPELREAICFTAAEMEREGWVEFLDVSPNQPSRQDPDRRDSTERRPGGKWGRESAVTPTISSDVCRLNVEVILREMLRGALRQLVMERYNDDGMAVAVVDTLHNAFPVHIASVSGQERGYLVQVNDHGYPPRPPSTSHSFPVESLRQTVQDQQGGNKCNANRFNSLLLKLCEGSDALLRSDETAPSSASPRGVIHGPVRLCYDTAVQVLQESVCERVVFSGHGVLGVRLIKLLLKSKMLEDRTLAEEAVATHSKTREVLHAMMRDGFVLQQEVPRTGVLAERQPKHSIFLWTCNMQQTLLPAVREKLIKSLTNALARLQEEVRRHQQEQTHTDSCATAPSALGGNGSPLRASDMEHLIQARDGKVPQDVVRRAVQSQRAVIGLQSCSLALMRMALLLDYY